MAKNLYIHTIDKDGKYKKEIWKDVKVTRDKGQIVRKREANYYLSMGRYKKKEMLDIINPCCLGYPVCKLSYVEMISFDKEILDKDDIIKICSFFIDDLNKDKIKLENEISEIDNKIHLFKNFNVE